MGLLEKCFIMLCTKTTERECVERGLFGDRKWRLDYLSEIQPGDLGYLFNMGTNELLGVFKARSKARLNIEEDAWFGEFPAQVEVEPLGRIRRLSDGGTVLAVAGVALDTLRSGTVVPLLPVQSGDIGERLLHAFDAVSQDEI